MIRLFSPILSWLKQTRPYSLYQLARRGYLHDRGWLVSVQRQQSVDVAGRPIPWITYPCLSFLKQRLNKQMAVFEYGSGNSTLWWAEHVGRVTSCEHDLGWYQKMKPRIPPHVELRCLALEYGGDYSREILNYPAQFDIVIVDGRDRINCLRNAPAALRNDGVIILDNSDRTAYGQGIAFLRQEGYRQLDFHGMGPINAYPSCTSIFYREQNCLGI